MLLAMVALATGLLAAGPPPAPRPSPRVDFVGQWVWTRDDAALYRETARERDLHAAVFVATVVSERGDLRLRRALSPRTADATAVVVRFEDSVHGVWDEGDDVAERIGELLARLVTEVNVTGSPIDEVQLDYDAPVRRLGAWAAVVRRLSRRELAEVAVWVTSIPAHMEAPGYGELFAGAVAGHILQLFDTGLACRDAEARALARDVERHGLAYRIGLGAFERGSGTDHGCWFGRWPELAGPRFEGLWVFPAGRPYLELLP